MTESVAQDKKGDVVAVDKKGVRIGNTKIISGIPPWVSDACGCDSELIQSVIMRFGNKSFAEVTVRLVPEADESARKEMDKLGLIFQEGSQS